MENPDSTPEPTEPKSPSEKKPVTITTNQAAEIIGCSPQQVRTLVRKGKIKAIKEPCTRNPAGYDLRIIKSSAQAYKNLVPRKGWPRGQKRR